MFGCLTYFQTGRFLWSAEIYFKKINLETTDSLVMNIPIDFDIFTFSTGFSPFVIFIFILTAVAVAVARRRRLINGLMLIFFFDFYSWPSLNIITNINIFSPSD